jgi:hypothetical protein
MVQDNTLIPNHQALISNPLTILESLKFQMA